MLGYTDTLGLVLVVALMNKYFMHRGTTCMYYLVNVSGLFSTTELGGSCLTSTAGSVNSSACMP